MQLQAGPIEGTLHSMKCLRHGGSCKVDFSCIDRAHQIGLRHVGQQQVAVFLVSLIGCGVQ